uniref:60S ribosomal protein L7a n=1 Tax=Hirondellea gigas TaxID=1518452 RepID=A0A2P2I6S0_9CRUS
MSRMIRWPRYIRIQRQRAILKARLKIPPAIHQFSETLDKNQASEIFKLMAKYRPENRKEKKHRLYQAAKDKVDQKQQSERDVSTKPKVLKFGLKHVTQLVEQKKAKLVVIAHDVEPIELVLWLPALCKKMDVPYCIVKSKARLGAFVHQKTAAVLAFTDVRKGTDDATLQKLCASVRPSFNDSATKSWGGGKLGIKAKTRVDRIEREFAREEQQKMEV